MSSEATDEDHAITATRNWLEHFVIRHGLCPFAEKPFSENRIRFTGYANTTEDGLVDCLVDEILHLKNTDAQVTETSIVVVSQMLDVFSEYNQFLDVVDAILEKLDVIGVIQVASFHPLYQFGDLDKNDVRNYTNRSPFPLFHLIREDSLEAACRMMNTADIPERNMALMESLGIDAVRKGGLKD